MSEERIFLKCDCQTEGIEVTVYQDPNEEKEYWFSFYGMGRSGYKVSWKYRFKLIWKVLSGKDLYGDMVIFSPEETKKLVEFLNKELS